MSQSSDVKDFVRSHLVQFRNRSALNQPAIQALVVATGCTAAQLKDSAGPSTASTRVPKRQLEVRIRGVAQYVDVLVGQALGIVRLCGQLGVAPDADTLHAFQVKVCNHALDRLEFLMAALVGEKFKKERALKTVIQRAIAEVLDEDQKDLKYGEYYAPAVFGEWAPRSSVEESKKRLREEQGGQTPKKRRVEKQGGQAPKKRRVEEPRAIAEEAPGGSGSASTQEAQSGGAGWAIAEEAQSGEAGSASTEEAPVKDFLQFLSLEYR
eukprot:TRINITY_DN2715_c0_g1_i11.p1 TRINITY_DN2715_c0_g1~~TRINITY_DN2715_c0_g1_i11.p1  ORF type:complete len:267 (+),score=47.00 TRINITY_DN2715_c0_g1_i11:147-947(+)